MQDTEENETSSVAHTSKFPVASSKESPVHDLPVQQDLNPMDGKQDLPRPVDTIAVSLGQEKTRSSFRFTLKKGEAIKSLETPLDTWRFVLITIALLVAGFMVSPCPLMFFLDELIDFEGRDRSIDFG
jgi:hypothetical protein